MELRIEWRTTGDTGNSIVFIDDDSNSVRRVIDGDLYKGDTRALSVFLNDVPDLDTGWEETPVAEPSKTRHHGATWLWPGPTAARCWKWTLCCSGTAYPSSSG